jgi:hypothetical protein
MPEIEPRDSPLGPHPCSGCFLLEQTGGVCPSARDQGLVTPAEIEATAQGLRPAVVADGGRTGGLAELIRAESRAIPLGAPRPETPLLFAPPANEINATRKEAAHALTSRSVR